MTIGTFKLNRNNSGTVRELLSRFRFLYQAAAEGSSPRVPHPGDVLYWVCGIGAMGALLFVTMR